MWEIYFQFSMKKIEEYPEIQNFITYTSLSDLELEEMSTDGKIFEHEEMCGLMQFYRDQPELAEQAIGLIGSKLPGMDTFKACATAICIGSITEDNIDCPSDKEIVHFFIEMSWKCCNYLKSVSELLGIAWNNLTLEQVEQADKAECYSKNPEGYKAYIGSYYLVMCIMTRICRKRELRDILRQTDQISGLCNYLAEFLSWYGYIHNVLEMSEEETITVLFPEKQTGLKVSTQQIDSSFLFMTLFQLEMAKTGVFADWGISYNYKELLDRKAHNRLLKNETDNIQNDTACLEYYTPYALQPDGTYSITKTDETGKSVVNSISRVWGEQPLQTIPRIEGQIVLLTDSHPLMNRSWDENFITPIHMALQPEVKLQRFLTSSEYNTWMNKIKQIVKNQ